MKKIFALILCISLVCAALPAARVAAADVDLSQEAILSLIERDISADAHPYIYASQSDFDKVRVGCGGGDAVLTDMYYKIKAKADTYLSKDVVSISLGDNGLSGGEEAERRIIALALVYMIEGDTAYAVKAYEQLKAVTDLETWGYSMLTTATLARCAAVGYDWLSGYMTEEQRQECALAIKEKALDVIEDIYKNPDDYYTWQNPTGTSQYGKFFGTTNHAFHNNAFFAVAALSVADRYPELSAFVLHNALTLMTALIDTCGPDGGFDEGCGYWNYYVPAFAKVMASLDSAFGTMLGFDENEILHSSAYFAIYTQSTVGSLVVGDTYPDNVRHNEEFYFMGIAFDDAQLQKYSLERGYGSLLLPLWYNGNDCSDIKTELALDKCYGNVGFVTMRNTWNSDYEIMTGFKVTQASDSGASTHMDTSSGMFFVDALGERWTGGLGVESYSLDGYFDYSETGKRWTYYARRAEANNCLVINPDSSPGQDIMVKPTIETFASKAGGAIAISDLSESYAEDVISYKRGVMLTDGRSRFVVQDEAVMKNPSEVYWFMNTKADIELSADGETAVLSQNGKKLLLKFKSNVNFSLSVMDSVPLPTSPNPEGQTDFSDTKKIALHADNVSELQLSCEMIPMWENSRMPDDFYCVIPMSQWTVSDSECDIGMSDVDSIESTPLTTYTNSAFSGIMMPQEFYRMQKDDDFSVFYIKDKAPTQLSRAYLTMYASVTGGAVLSPSLNIYAMPSETNLYTLSGLSTPINSHTAKTAAIEPISSKTIFTDSIHTLVYDITDYIPKTGDDFVLAFTLYKKSDNYFIISSHCNNSTERRPCINYQVAPDR